MPIARKMIPYEIAKLTERFEMKTNHQKDNLNIVSHKLDNMNN